ncbi:hypothetical protein D3C84_1255510 [compost metagenome]
MPPSSISQARDCSWKKAALGSRALRNWQTAKDAKIPSRCATSSALRPGSSLLKPSSPSGYSR